MQWAENLKLASELNDAIKPHRVVGLIVRYFRCGPGRANVSPDVYGIVNFETAHLMYEFISDAWQYKDVEII